LRGVFLARPADIAWVHCGEGASAIYPDAWEEFVSHLSAHDIADPLSAYYNLLTSNNAEEQAAAATAWSNWEASIMSLTPNEKEIAELTVGERSISLARTECHYAVNGFFMPTENYILENVETIGQIPCHIIHGRYDIVCPAHSAWRLYKALPRSMLTIVQDGAHTLSDGGMTSALIAALSECA